MRSIHRKMTRPLNSDQLGKKGETRFSDLCIDAGLIPNQSDWDRKGWDFVVDWPQHAVSAYDQRPMPLSALVQLKTVWIGATSVSLRLSSAEHIARDIKPAFICILEIGNDLNVEGLRLIHVAGEFLAKILRKLRQARIDGTAPNTLEIDAGFSTFATVLEPNGIALKTAMEAAIGASMSGYASAKHSELQNLGYTDGNFRLSGTLAPTDSDHLVEAFLGLRPINFLDTTGAETRFNLEIPYPELTVDKAVIKLQPEPFDTCEIRIRPGDMAPVLRFYGKMYRAPYQLLKVKIIDFLLKTDFFSIRVKANLDEPDPIAVSLQLIFDPEELSNLRVPVADWHRYYLFLAAMSVGPVEIEIEPKESGLALNGMAAPDRPAHDPEFWTSFLKASEKTVAIFERAGAEKIELSDEEIRLAWPDIAILDAMIAAPELLSPLDFINPSQQIDEKLVGQGLYFNWIDFGDHGIVYAALTDFEGVNEGQNVRWKAFVRRVVDVRWIELSLETFEKFKNRVEQKQNIGASLVARYPENKDKSKL
jgi:hypothetical protein